MQCMYVPGGPGCPMRPSFPFLPGSPEGPCLPSAPFAPESPDGPSGPTSPFSDNSEIVRITPKQQYLTMQCMAGKDLILWTIVNQLTRVLFLNSFISYTPTMLTGNYYTVAKLQKQWEC